MKKYRLYRPFRVHIKLNSSANITFEIPLPTLDRFQTLYYSQAPKEVKDFDTFSGFLDFMHSRTDSPEDELLHYIVLTKSFFHDEVKNIAPEFIIDVTSIMNVDHFNELFSNIVEAQKKAEKIDVVFKFNEYDPELLEEIKDCSKKWINTNKRENIVVLLILYQLSKEEEDKFFSTQDWGVARIDDLKQSGSLLDKTTKTISWNETDLIRQEVIQHYFQNDLHFNTSDNNQKLLNSLMESLKLPGQWHDDFDKWRKNNDRYSLYTILYAYFTEKIQEHFEQLFKLLFENSLSYVNSCALQENHGIDQFRRFFLSEILMIF